MTKIFLLFGALLVIIVTLVIAQAQARGRAPGSASPLREVPLSCRVNGHAYGEHDTGWRCATCGNFVPRHEGEQYGLVSDGRHERRRHGR